MFDFNLQENNKEYKIFNKSPKKSLWRRLVFGSWILILIVILLGVGGALVYKTGFTFSQINTGEAGDIGLTENMATPLPEEGRKNILLLGLRGEGDPDGGLLTDSIMVVSIQEATGRIALISIPRDLYVTIPGTDKKEKINYAYAFGFEKKGAAGALLFSKIAVARATGLYIDKAIAVNHQAFKEVISALGGIVIKIDKPFVEEQQWISGGDLGVSPFFSIKTDVASTSDGIIETRKWVFEIPAGVSLLGGDSALYFVRARYSSSDFDRARRQQIILTAVKDKALSLGVLMNPVKIFQILDSLGRNVRTDMALNDLSDLIALADDYDSKNIIRKVFDTTPEGLLYDAQTDAGIYILLPQGDDFSIIQEACKNIFD